VKHTRGKKLGQSPLQKGLAPILLTPCIVAAFLVTSEPHTRARPSVRLCVGSDVDRCVHMKYNSHLYSFLVVSLIRLFVKYNSSQLGKRYHHRAKL
jgi:hypothetical protein